jgi:hypothetical protein
MNHFPKEFILKLLFLCLFMELASLGFYFFMPQIYSVHLLFIPLYFLGLLVFFHITLLKSIGKRPQTFVSKYMLLTGIKLFVNLGVLLGLIFTIHEKVVVVVLGFLANYMVYTFFEVRELLKEFSKSS